MEQIKNLPKQQVEHLLKTFNVPFLIDNETGKITIHTSENSPVVGKRTRAYYCPSQKKWQVELKKGTYIRQYNTKEDAEQLIQIIEARLQ
jgi:hypothetical protein